MTGSSDYTVNPGEETDQGQVLSSEAPVTFDGYGNGDAINLTGTGAGGVTVNGTNENDDVSVALIGANNTITVFGREAVQAVGVTLPIATINTFEGHDFVRVNGNNTFTTINANGSDGDDDDTLFLFNNSGAAAIDLGNSFATGYGGMVNFTGFQTIDANANAQNLTILATADDDTVTVTPFTANSGRLQANGNDPVVNYSNLGATFTVNTLGGEDLLVVNGNTSSEVITVNATTVTASGAADQLRGCGGLTRQWFSWQRHIQCYCLGQHGNLHRRRKFDWHRR